MGLGEYRGCDRSAISASVGVKRQRQLSNSIQGRGNSYKSFFRQNGHTNLLRPSNKQRHSF